LIEIWKNILIQPEETIAGALPDATLGRGLKNFAIAALIPGVLLGLGIAVLSFIFAPLLASLPEATILGTIGIVAIVIVPLAAVTIALVGSLLFNLALWVGAKVAGGKGSFSEQYYLISLMAVPFVLAQIAIALVGFILFAIPVVGFFAGMLAVSAAQGYLGIISVVAFISAMKVSHNFSTKKLGIAVGVGYAIMGLLGAIAGFLLVVTVFGFIAAIAGSFVAI